MRRLSLGLAALVAAVMASAAAEANAVPAAPTGPAVRFSAQTVIISPGLITTQQDASTACVLPDGSAVSWLHCYTPQQIRAAYGVDSVADIPVDDQTVPNYGQGQTIVLVDAYGSPTAEADLRHFHDTFFPSLPAPAFEQVFPQGNPQFDNTCTSSGLSGPCAAASWSLESSLDIEWAHAIAPLAHIVLLAVPPAETLGVQGFPNLFNAISGEIDATPPGTLFSMSLGVPEQTFGGSAAVQTAQFDRVFQAGLAKHDNFFTASHDFGSRGIRKQAKESRFYSTPVAWWPASAPYVVSVGGTQLQDSWTWNPASNDAFTGTGDFNPDYWQWTDGGNSEAVWNESWLAALVGGGATGGGASAIYPRPPGQQDVAPGLGDHRRHVGSEPADRRPSCPRQYRPRLRRQGTHRIPRPAALPGCRRDRLHRHHTAALRVGPEDRRRHGRGGRQPREQVRRRPARQPDLAGPGRGLPDHKPVRRNDRLGHAKSPRVRRGTGSDAVSTPIPSPARTREQRPQAWLTRKKAKCRDGDTS